MKKQGFSWRAFISLGLFLAFLALLVSGAVLYLSPPGRVANWTDWQVFGLTKTQWQHQHTVFSIAFALLSIFHLFSINWKAFWSYIRTKARAGLSRPFEITAILLLSLITGAGTYLKTPPFSSIIDFGDYLSGSWEQEQSGPPVPHTERMTLREIAIRFSPETEPEELRKKLEASGVSVLSIDQTLEDIAGKNGLSSENVYNRLGIATPSATGRGGGGGGRRNQ